MDFHTWWTSSALSLAEIARLTRLPLVTLLQLDQGHCDSLDAARRLRMKLYERYRDPVILSWTFREDDEGGLPVWWWRCTWEEPNLARVCLLLPAKSLGEARDHYWHWMDRHRMPVAPRVRWEELGELPESFPELYPHQPAEYQPLSVQDEQKERC